jgi:hypothetical protein
MEALCALKFQKGGKLFGTGQVNLAEKVQMHAEIERCPTEHRCVKFRF